VKERWGVPRTNFAQEQSSNSETSEKLVRGVDNFH